MLAQLRLGLGIWLALSMGAVVPGQALAGPSPTKLGFIVQPSDVVAGNAIAPAVQVALQANSGSTVTTATDTVTIGIYTNPEGGTLSGTLSVPAVGGVATFSDLRIDRPGSGYILWAYSGTLVDATSLAFEVVNPGLLLTPARSMAPATLLPNGKVLLAGGYDGAGSSAEANLFDSATGAWSSIAPLSTVRRAPSAAFLPNGKVLVAGGYTGSSRLASAELYDPVTGAWSPTGSLTVGRSGATATVLTNGKVLVVGGYGIGELASAELYDPASGIWTTTGAPSVPRDGHTATLLPDGRVLVTGGYTASGPTYHPTAEIYDFGTGQWSPAGTMSTGRSEHTATLLPDGKVLVVGGRTSGALASADLFDPAAGTWAPTGPLAGGRYHHTATLLPNGRVLVVGGYDLAALASTEVYDPAAGTWSAGPAPKAARYGHNATLLPDGRVLIAAGSDTSGVLARSEILSAANGNWSSAGSLSYTGGGGLKATLLPSGKVLVTGGSTSVTAFANANLFDPAAGSFSSTGSMLTKRDGHTATLLPDGKVLVAGGDSTVVGTELYDPAAGSWSWTGSLTSARSRHTATLLPNGKVLVVGGLSGSGGLASAELYDPATGTWSPAGTTSVGRYNHTATLLPGGKVLIAGGEGAGGATAVAELYDSASGTWSTTGSLWSAHARHTATLLLDGKVLLAGGWDASPSASTEIYDPASGAWSLGDLMKYARSLHTAALLPNGKVLVMSGSNGAALSACELYDPSSGTWSDTTSASSRYGHASAALADGRVLLVGGLGSGATPLASAYVYDEGRGSSSAWAPTLSGPLPDVAAGTSLAVTGSRFTGISEAHSGSSLASSSNYPLFRFERQDGGEVAWMTLTAFSPTTASIVVPAGAQPGTYWVRPFVNGIPGTAQALRVTSGATDTTPPTSPGLPAGAPNPSNGSVVVTWTGSSDAGSGVKDYAIEVSSDNQATWSAPVWIVGTSYTQTSPTQGSWWYRVTARDNAFNTSAAVVSASAVVVDTTPPGAPGAPAGSPNPSSGGDVTVSWTASSGDTGGSGFVGYLLEVSDDEQLSWSSPVSVAGTSWTHLAPSAGRYWYRVTAVDGAGNEAASVSLSAVVVDATAPTSPGVPTGAPNPGNGADVTVSWTASTDVGGAGLKDYGVEISSNGGTSWSAPVYVATNSYTHAAPAQGSYLYRVAARDNVLNASAPVTSAVAVVVDTTAPAAPGAPVGSPNPGPGGDVMVSWTASAGDTGGAGLKDYGVEISSNGGTSWSAAVYVATSSYTHAAPAQGSYLYRVTARDNVLNASAPVTSAVAVVVDTTAPASPGAPSGSPNPGNGADVTVSWTASTDVGGAGVKDYGVEISSNGGASWSAPVYVATNSYTHTAPAQGSYLYRVTVRDNVLNTSAAVTSAVVIVDKTAPAGLSPVTGNPSPTNGNVTVSWLAATDTGGSTLLDYQVQTSNDGKASWSASAPVAPPTTSWTHLAPAEGSWWYRVTARDAAGNALVAESASAVLVDRAAPSDPGSVAGSPSPSNGDVTVTWTPAVDSGSGVKDYLVETSVDGKVSWQSAGTATTPSHMQSSPAEGTYWYRITARDQAGNASGAVASATAVVVDRTAPSGPGVPSGTPNPATADVVVSWGASSDGAGAGLSGYILEVSDDEKLSWSAPTSVAGASWLQVAPAEGRYWYRVSAQDQAGNASAPSASLVAVVVDRTAPSAPGVPSASPNPSRGDVTVSWVAAGDGGAGLAAYVLETSGDGGLSWSAPFDVGATSYLHGSPAQGSWLYRIRARDAAGNLSPAVTSAPAVVDRTAPSAPGTPSSSYDPGSGQVTVSWAASTDGGGSGFAYRIERSADGGASWSAPATAGTNGYLDPGLSPGSYLYRVTAVDGAGNASASAVTSTPVVVDPSLPVAGQVRDGLSGDLQFQGSTSTVSASWSGFADPESGIAGYEWAIGTTAGGTEVRGFASVGSATQATATGLTLVEGTTYYVSVRATNGAGRTTEARSDGVMVDGTAPAGGAVADGASADLATQASTSTLSANWSGFSDAGSGLASYSWAIGTAAGASDVRGFTSVGMSTSGSAGGLALANGATYFVTVRAYDRAGLFTDVTSDGVRVVVPFFSVRLSGPVSPTQQGEAHDLRLEVLDGLGAAATGYQGTLVVTSSDSLAQLPTAVTLTAADGGVKDLAQSVVFWTAGTQSLTATDSANPALTGSLVPLEVQTAVAPGIVREANGRAAVGIPYRYSALGRVRAVGSAPIHFASCGGPPGFVVEPLDGTVRWTPTQAGVVPLSLCVFAENAAGQSIYRFDVSVVASTPPGPRAVLDVTPSSGVSPVLARFSGSASSADPGALPLMYLWDFGDGTPGQPGPEVQHLYTLPGEYRPTLTVWDAFGRRASASGTVTAFGSGAQVPPSVRIVASALEGQDTLAVELRAEVTAGSAPVRGYLWDLGQDETATTLIVRKTFGPGRWHVGLEVADAAGLSSRDSVEIVVTRGAQRPPECRARVTPASGNVPVSARWSAEASTHTGTAPMLRWTFSDGTASGLAEVARTYAAPGLIVGRLRVEDETGLSCEDGAQLEALSASSGRAPRIVAEPVDAARCWLSYPQEGPPTRLSAVGDGPLRWRLVEGPEGLTVDEASGELRWKPDPRFLGPARIVVAVENAVGTDQREFELPIQCGQGVALEIVGCGCGSAGPGAWLPLGLAGLAAVGVRRRRPGVADSVLHLRE